MKPAISRSSSPGVSQTMRLMRSFGIIYGLALLLTARGPAE